jgi:hypothetical protein
MIEQAVVATVGFEEFFTDRYPSTTHFAVAGSVVSYHAEDVEITVNGVPAEATIEHGQGFTFAYGPAPAGHPSIEVTIGGPAKEDPCPSRPCAPTT